MENTKYDDKFYRLPKRLFKEDQFRSMTNEAKTLYMILLDRRCLSECNGDAWRDEYGAIFIIFTIKEMMKLLHLGNSTSFSPVNTSSIIFLMKVVFPAPKNPEIMSIFVISISSFPYNTSFVPKHIYFTRFSSILQIICIFFIYFL